MALKTTRTTSIVDATSTTGNALYNVRYQVEEVEKTKTLMAVHVEISAKGEHESYTNVGNMDYNNGQISLNGFPFNEKTVTYMTEFSAIVEEIKGQIK